MQLWLIWWEAIYLLLPGFSRVRTFMSLAFCVAGLTVRTDKHGVSSIVRALDLDGSYYDNLLDTFHSSGIKLDTLTKIWVKTVLHLFTNPVRINDRLVLVGDGIKLAKQGKKMPGVKSLHQESESNNKAEYIMGHSFQAVSLLCRAGGSVLAVPLAARIHEGVVFSNRSKKTLLDKMVDLLMILGIEEPYYFVADAYYANQKIIKGMLAEGHHLVSRVRSNAVAYEPHVEMHENKKGRRKIYGQKIKLKALMENEAEMLSASSPVYGEEDVTIQYCARNLI
ncbi:MAG: transposase [Pseudomonadales bacterium]|nr:transposase [Pseudomonadales bacterium]